MLYIKNNKKNTKEEIEYGYLNNQEYKKYLLNKYEEINKKIPSNNEEKPKIEQKIKYLKEE